MNLYNPQDYVLQFFEDYSIIMNNVIYDAWYGKGLKILISKQMLQRLLIILA